MIDEYEKKEITLILADDHEVVRSGIKRLISVDKSFKILDEAWNGEDCIELVKRHNPDIALVDIFMPKMNGIEATNVIKRLYPNTIVVILSAFEDALHLEQAMEAGADGYLSKEISSRNLIDSLHNVMNGERVFSKSILQLLQKKYTPFTSEDSSPVVITAREQEILNFVATGKTSPEIADELNISVRTVQTHRSNIMQKLGIKTPAGLIRYAIVNADKRVSPEKIDNLF